MEDKGRKLAEIVGILEVRVGTLAQEELESISKLVDLGFESEDIIDAYDANRNFARTIKALVYHYQQCGGNISRDGVKDTIALLRERNADVWFVLKYVNLDNFVNPDYFEQDNSISQMYETVWNWFEAGADVDTVINACDICFEEKGAYQLQHIGEIIKNLNYKEMMLGKIEEVKKYLNIQRALTPKEHDMLANAFEAGFDVSHIKLAFKKTFDAIGKINFLYAKSIMDNWICYNVLPAAKSVENLMGRKLDVSEMEFVISWIYKGANIDCILFILQRFCKKQNEYDFRRADGLINEAMKNGLKTAKDIDKYYERVKQVVKLSQAIGITFSNWEQTAAAWWFEEFDFACIKYACDLTVQKLGRFNADYVNGIIENWRRNGIRTIEDIKTRAAKNKKKRDSARRNEIVFLNDKHNERYLKILGAMVQKGQSHKAMAYLLALDENISCNEERLTACFNFSENAINPDVLASSWITESDRRILALAFNLWNSSHIAVVSDVFSDSENIDYLLEAVRIRFGNKESEREDQ